jgi:hypothetical protein
MHWVDRKQPWQCGVDTVTSPVDAVMRLRLAVYDSKGGVAWAERVIRVVAPCEEGQSYCELPAAAGAETEWACMDAPCAQWRGVAPMAAAAVAAPPRLFLLPSAHASNLSVVRGEDGGRAWLQGRGE